MYNGEDFTDSVSSDHDVGLCGVMHVKSCKYAPFRTEETSQYVPPTDAFLGKDSIVDGIVKMRRICVECWVEGEVGMIDPVLDGVGQEVSKGVDIVGEQYGLSKCGHGIDGLGIAGAREKTGPEHWSRVSVLVARTHPKVPSLLVRPPSDAMFIRCLDWNAFHRASSVATCCRETRSLRWLFGSCLMRDFKDGGGCGGGPSCGLVMMGRRGGVGEVFQYGM